MNKICVISLTYNRPEYIKRSFESLYKRAGLPFNHYVFDDGSDRETINVLNKLQKEYGFNLFKNKKRANIAVNFSKAVLSVPDKYDYYVKFDSDTEVLSDNLFSEMLEVFAPIVSGASPRVEGVFSYERCPEDVIFYNGHVIRKKLSVAFGCCMMVRKSVIDSFKEIAEKKIKEKEKFGIDTCLYETAISIGNYIKVEDLSVYHIDNNYGQRKNFDYFNERKRWKGLDDAELYFIKASKILKDLLISKEIYYNIYDISVNFDDFLNKLKLYYNKEDTGYGYSLVKNKYGKVFPVPNEQLEEILTLDKMELIEKNTGIL